MPDFTLWFENQLKERNLTKSEFAEISGIDSGTVSNVANDIRRPGPEICRKIARALNLPQAVVFYKAGLLTEQPDFPELNAIALDILAMLENRSASEIEAARATLVALLETFDRSGNGRSTRRDSATPAGSKRG